MITAPDHLLSLDEWVALPEDTSRTHELQEGVLIASPRSHLVAEQVLVAVEVVTDGTRLTDAVTKPVEYPHAGIPFYWLMDPGDPVSLVAYRLTDGRYEQTAAVTGMFETSEPFPLRVDQDTLSRRAGARERV